MLYNSNPGGQEDTGAAKGIYYDELEAYLAAHYVLGVEEPAAAYRTALDDCLNHTAENFQELFNRYLEADGRTHVEIYKKALLNRKTYAKLKSPAYRPSKETALALALALELSVEDTERLLARAGYAMSPSSRFDLAVRFFIERGIYDVSLIDEALTEHSLPTIASYS